MLHGFAHCPIPTLFRQSPGWTPPRGRESSELDAAFAAGIAFKSLDNLVRTAPIWASCWRFRQALKCAAVVVRLMGRNEDQAALRDAVLPTATGDDPRAVITKLVKKDAGEQRDVAAGGSSPILLIGAKTSAL
ncbi:DUF1403 family protein [Shinella sp.]|uniref:DUF1403 family protein n=1 Tax=Shinella sp. TaxID=1870904 RepID=UPI003F7062CB